MNNAFSELLHSPRRTMVFFRWFFGAAVLMIAIFSIVLSVLPLLPPQVYQKDFIQEYLLARAFMSGVNPYILLPDLGDILMGELPVALYPHSMPYPPPVIFLALPFGLVSYPVAASLWYLVELVCLALIIWILVRWLFVRPQAYHYIGAAVLMLLWSPVKDELVVGQMTSILLLLLVLAWQRLQRGKDISAGILLGIALALKLIAWPIPLYLLIRWRWKAVLSTGITFIVLNLGAGALLGFDKLVNYYLVIGGQVARLCIAHERNFSIWTVGYRLFDGMSSPATVSASAPPMVSIPWLAPYVSGGLVVLLLAYSLYLALRAADLDIAMAVLTCACILLSPIAWSHYLILMIIPVSVLIKRWIDGGHPNIPIAHILSLVFLFVCIGIRSMMLLVSGVDLNPVYPLEVTFGASLFSLAPMVAVLAVMMSVSGSSTRRAALTPRPAPADQPHA